MGPRSQDPSYKRLRPDNWVVQLRGFLSTAESDNTVPHPVRSLAHKSREVLVHWPDRKSHYPRIPFVRTWPGTEVLLPTTLDSLLPCRNFPLQLFKPVRNDIDLRRRLVSPAGLDHQEALAVGRDIVVGVGDRTRTWLELSREKHFRLARGKARLRGDRRSHHHVAAAVEQLPPARIPQWLCATF